MVAKTYQRTQLRLQGMLETDDWARCSMAIHVSPEPSGSIAAEMGVMHPSCMYCSLKNVVATFPYSNRSCSFPNLSLGATGDN